MICSSWLQRRKVRHKLAVCVRVAAVVFVSVALITPVRNALVPSCLWYRPWDDVHSLKLLRVHLVDWFYPMDRTPYTGRCQHVRQYLAPLDSIRLQDLPVYSLDAWTSGWSKVKGRLSPEDRWKVEHFKPSLSPQEQRELLYSVLVLSKAFDIFNITYFMAEGTLIGLQRHHGLIPWDDDADILVKGSQWRLAKEVLSCIPGFSLSIGWDFMWKFMWNESSLWQGETFIRFPYVDVFPYNEDSEHLWPLTIWMKREIMWRVADTYPAQRVPLEGQHVPVPANPSAILRPTYGKDTHTVCASRGYKRKEREPFPMSERVRVPCSDLHEIYPFVFHHTDPKDGSQLQLRKVGDKVLSSFKPH